MTPTHTVGIDVGASKVSAGIVDASGAVVERGGCLLTPRSASEGLIEPLAEIVSDLSSRGTVISGIGVGAAGLVRWPSGELVYAANHSHGQLDLRRRLEDVSGLPVVVDNDANAAAWGESRREPNEAVLFLAIGTGLGSGFVSDGQLMRGPGGRGAELGHVVVDPAGPRCSCGLHGCLEAIASGRALRIWAEAYVRDHPGSAFARTLSVRSPAVSLRQIVSAALDGDPLICARVALMGNVLGRSIGHHVMSLFPVDRVIVGGGLGSLGDLLLTPIRDGCTAVMTASSHLRSPRFTSAVYGRDSVIVGAGLLANEVLGIGRLDGRSSDVTVPSQAHSGDNTTV